MRSCAEQLSTVYSCAGRGQIRSRKFWWWEVRIILPTRTFESRLRWTNDSKNPKTRNRWPNSSTEPLGWCACATERITPRNDSFFSSLIKDPFKMNESFKTDPSLATSARATNESGSYLCASNVTPTAVRFIVSVFLCLLCSCRMSSTQMTCSHFRKNRPKKRQKPAGCRSRIISKNRPVPIFGRSTGASLIIVIILGANGPLATKNIS